MTVGSERPQVLHVLAPARQGGMEQVVAMMAERQKKKGVHVAAVVAPDDAVDHPFLSQLGELGVHVTPVVVGGRSYVREYRKLRELMTSLRPTVVHTHGYHADIVAGLAARAARIPRAATVHGFVGVPLRNLVYERLQLIALRQADAVIAVSRPLVDRVAKSGVSREKIHFVPNGLAAPRILLTRDEARRRLGIGPGLLVAGWVGRLSQEKGADVMIDSIAVSGDAWRLSVIGEGPERDSLVRRARKLGISDRVVFHGPIPGAAAFLRAFDAFVLSSRTEGTPIALLEAMDAGVPVIATRVGGIPDVAGPDEALLVPSEDPEAIAAALAEMRRDPTAAARRAEHARNKVRSAFDADAWVDRIDQIYRSIESKSR